MLNSLSPLGIILINYNGFDLTSECIESLKRSSRKDIRIYVVDNASPDASGVRLREVYSDDAEFVLSPVNTGTAGANNTGMKLAFEQGCGSVLILNNDTAVYEDTLNLLLENSDENCVSAPLITYYSKPSCAWYAGGYFDFFGNARHERMGESVNGSDFSSRYVDFASGCCLLIPRRVWDKIGGFDEDYFMYWEDTDYCFKLKENNIKIKYIPSARVLHKVSASSGGEGSPLSYYYCVRNRLYGIDKLKLGFKPWLWARMALVRGLLSRSNECKFALKAWKDYRAGRMGYVDLS